MFLQGYYQHQSSLPSSVFLVRCILALLLIACALSGGCSSTEIVYGSLAPHPEELKGALTIATNKKIRVTVGESVSEKDLGAYIALHPRELAALLKENDTLRNGLDNK